MATRAIAIEDAKTGDITEAVYEHPFVVRLCHWVNAVSLFVMVGSGLQIFRAFPSFGAKIPQKDLLNWPKAFALDSSDRNRMPLFRSTAGMLDGFPPLPHSVAGINRANVKGRVRVPLKDRLFAITAEESGSDTTTLGRTRQLIAGLGRRELAHAFRTGAERETALRAPIWSVRQAVGGRPLICAFLPVHRESLKGRNPPFATFPDAGVGRPAPARQGGGMPIAITAAVARPWIIDPPDTIGNHCGMLCHQSLFKQLRLPLAQADRSLPP